MTHNISRSGVPIADDIYEPDLPCEARWRFTTPWGVQPILGQAMSIKSCLKTVNALKEFQKQLIENKDRYVGVNDDVQLNWGEVSKEIFGKRIRRTYGHVYLSRFTRFLECADKSVTPSQFNKCEQFLGPLYESFNQKEAVFNQCQEQASPCNKPERFHSLFKKNYEFEKEQQEWSACEEELKKTIEACRDPIRKQAYRY